MAWRRVHAVRDIFGSRAQAHTSGVHGGRSCDIVLRSTQRVGLTRTPFPAAAASTLSNSIVPPLSRPLPCVGSCLFSGTAVFCMHCCWSCSYAHRRAACPDARHLACPATALYSSCIPVHASMSVTQLAESRIHIQQLFSRIAWSAAVVYHHHPSTRASMCLPRTSTSFICPFSFLHARAFINDERTFSFLHA